MRSLLVVDFSYIYNFPRVFIGTVSPRKDILYSKGSFTSSSYAPTPPPTCVNIHPGGTTCWGLTDESLYGVNCQTAQNLVVNHKKGNFYCQPSTWSTVTKAAFLCRQSVENHATISGVKQLPELSKNGVLKEANQWAHHYRWSWVAWFKGFFYSISKHRLAIYREG